VNPPEEVGNRLDGAAFFEAELGAILLLRRSGETLHSDYDSYFYTDHCHLPKFKFIKDHE